MKKKQQGEAAAFSYCASGQYIEKGIVRCAWLIKRLVDAAWSWICGQLR